MTRGAVCHAIALLATLAPLAGCRHTPRHAALPPESRFAEQRVEPGGAGPALPAPEPLPAPAEGPALDRLSPPPTPEVKPAAPMPPAPAAATPAAHKPEWTAAHKQPAAQPVSKSPDRPAAPQPATKLPPPAAAAAPATPPPAVAVAHAGGPPAHPAGPLLPGTPDPHQRLAPTAYGSVAQLPPGESPAERAVELTRKLELSNAEKVALTAKVRELEEALLARERRLGDVTRQVGEATAEVARARKDLAGWAEELRLRQSRLREQDRENQELLKAIIAMLEKMVGPDMPPGTPKPPGPR